MILKYVIIKINLINNQMGADKMNDLKQTIKKWMSIEGVPSSEYKSYLYELLDNEIITEEEYHELKNS